MKPFESQSENDAQRLALLAKALGGRWAIPILLLIRDEGQRFTKIEERLGVSRRVIAVRLDELAEFGLVERISYREVPPRVEYCATPSARALLESLERALSV